MTTKELLLDIPPVLSRTFRRDDAVLDVKRKAVDEVAYRQGGPSGMWVHCTLDELAKAMNDGGGDWIPESVAAGTFPIGGPRQAVFDALLAHGFKMSGWSDKHWLRGDIEAHVYLSGSYLRIKGAHEDDGPIADVLRRLPAR